MIVEKEEHNTFAVKCAETSLLHNRTFFRVLIRYGVIVEENEHIVKKSVEILHTMSFETVLVHA